MTHCRIKTWLWGMAFAATGLLPAACGDPHTRRHTIMPETTALRPGDVVLRRGCGMTSRAVLMADRGDGYSHVGIVVDSSGTMMVVHAVPEEPDYDGDYDRVKMDAPEKFYASINARAGAVMRCADSAVAARAAQAAKQVYGRGTPFDHDYDDSDTTKMYCCELVEFAYTQAGRPLTTAPRHSFVLPGMRIDSVILPSDFCSSARLRCIAEF